MFKVGVVGYGPCLPEPDCQTLKPFTLEESSVIYPSLVVLLSVLLLSIQQAPRSYIALCCRSSSHPIVAQFLVLI